MIRVGKYFIITARNWITASNLRISECPTKSNQASNDPGGKKIEGVNAALAASFEVLKIPMPITSPITIIVRGNKPSLFFSLIGVEDRKKTFELKPQVHGLTRQKKIIGVGDAAATFTGVRKIPMPITRLTTIIVKSKSPNLFFSLIL